MQLNLQLSNHVIAMIPILEKFLFIRKPLQLQKLCWYRNLIVCLLDPFNEYRMEDLYRNSSKGNRRKNLQHQ